MLITSAINTISSIAVIMKKGGFPQIPSCFAFFFNLLRFVQLGTFIKFRFRKLVGIIFDS